MVTTPKPATHKSGLLFKLKEQHYQQQVRSEITNRMRRLNSKLHKTREEMNRARNSLYLGRLSNMRKYEIEDWEEYIDTLAAKERRIEEELRKYEQTEQELYLCCSDEIKEYFLEVGSKLKDAFPSLRLENIYSALIMTAYSLLTEVYDDMLTLKHLDDKAFDLYIQIASGDIMHNGENLSSEIRRFLFGLKTDMSGGRTRRQTKTKRRTRKSKKTRNTRRKY